eukprot:5957278-Amphidinium_carterae.1
MGKGSLFRRLLACDHCALVRIPSLPEWRAMTLCPATIFARLWLTLVARMLHETKQLCKSGHETLPQLEQRMSSIVAWFLSTSHCKELRFVNSFQHRSANDPPECMSNLN